jgi:hypothetical protein
MEILPDASAGSLHRFLTRHVEPGVTVITDGWMGYHGITRLGYAHVRRSQRAARASGEDPGKLLPGVHRVASLAKRWLLGTHQGSVEDAHLQTYLNEFCFRFNRRRSRSRANGLLPRARTRRRPRSGAIPGPGRSSQAQGEATHRARPARSPTERRAPPGG